MATLLVSDTSVLLDLHRGGVLEPLFKLAFEFGVPDVLFERELAHWDGPALEPLGLRVLVLDAAGVTLAQVYRSREPKLSLPDAFALALAKAGGADPSYEPSALSAAGERVAAATGAISASVLAPMRVSYLGHG